MRTTRLITLAAISLAITAVTTPALAQSRGNDAEQRARDRGARATQSGDQGRQARSGEAVRRQAPDANSARASGSSDRGAAVRGGSSSATDTRSRAATSNRATDNRATGNRATDSRAYATPRNDARSNGSRGNSSRAYDTRSYDNRANNSRAYGYGSRAYDWNRYGWYGTYDRNAWRSRVRFGLGISIFSGNPFSFRFAYGWQPSFRYRYSVMPGVAYGGMSFLLDPDWAEVYIDGQFVGIARDFGGQPVPVPAGFHRIELYAQGFEPVAFDVNVRPGQVIPYRGSLYQVY